MRFEFALLSLAVSLAGSASAAPYPADGIIARAANANDTASTKKAVAAGSAQNKPPVLAKGGANSTATATGTGAAASKETGKKGKDKKGDKGGKDDKGKKKGKKGDKGKKGKKGDKGKADKKAKTKSPSSPPKASRSFDRRATVHTFDELD